MIRLEDAGVRFGERWILRHVQLDLTAGTSMALLGPNGRGKTTLIKAALGLHRLSEGRRHAPAVVGYVPQAGGSILPYNVLDVVVMGRSSRLGVFGSPSRSDFRASRAALAEVGMEQFADRSYALLSGGERQLVLLARAIATEADTIVLDEPASALDLANQNRFLTVLDGFRRTRRYAILFSTHVPQHAMHASDETMLLMEGLEMLHGATAAVMTEANIERLYGVAVRGVEVGDGDLRTKAFVPLFGGAGPQPLTRRVA